MPLKLLLLLKSSTLEYAEILKSAIHPLTFFSIKIRLWKNIFFFYVHTRTEHKNRLQVESNSAIKYRFYILDLISKKQQLTVQII